MLQRLLVAVAEADPVRERLALRLAVLLTVLKAVPVTVELTDADPVIVEVEVTVDVAPMLWLGLTDAPWDRLLLGLGTGVH